MLLASLRPIGRAINVLCGGSTPHEIALGLALGIVLGLIPKTNLTAVLLCGLILSLRVNLSATALATCACMGLTPVLDGIAHQIGLTALTLRPMQSVWAWFFRQPLVPWLRLDDTLVLGQLLIGVTLAWPTYSVACRVISRVQPGLAAVMSRSTVARLMLGVRQPAERRAA